MADEPLFDAASLASLDEPVRRYFIHALADGEPLHERIELRMTGRIRVGRWLGFTAKQRFSGHDFEWLARAGIGPLKPLYVADRFKDGRGSTEGRVLGRARFLHSEDANTARSAAGRAAAETIWVPASLLPQRGVSWRAEGEDHIVARVPVPPEEPKVHIRINPSGGVTSVSLLRWGNVGRPDFGYIPFGGRISAERRFGDAVIPSRISIGWWFGTPRFSPFFEATVTDARPLA